MGTKEKIKLVGEYLIVKKITLDILIKVEDHFFKKIENYILHEKISFHASEKMKNFWKDDFKTYLF